MHKLGGFIPAGGNTFVHSRPHAHNRRSSHRHLLDNSEECPLSAMSNGDQQGIGGESLFIRAMSIEDSFSSILIPQTEWITKEHLAELLYSKFLISVPMIFDIIIAYGRPNVATLQRLITTIIKIERKYQNDLAEGLQFLVKAFNTIQEKVMENSSSTSFEDLALYALDCAATINLLVEVYPEAYELCQRVQLEQGATNFYDLTIPLLYKNIYLIDRNSIGIKYLNHARVHLLGFFRAIINVYLEKVLADP